MAEKEPTAARTPIIKSSFFAERPARDRAAQKNCRAIVRVRVHTRQSDSSLPPPPAGRQANSACQAVWRATSGCYECLFGVRNALDKACVCARAPSYRSAWYRSVTPPAIDAAVSLSLCLVTTATPAVARARYSSYCERDEHGT